MVKSREILRRLMRRFGLLILLTLIGGIAGAVYGAVKTPTYTAKAYVVATGDRGDSITALNYAQAYGRIATSGPVLAKAGTLLGADRSGLADVTAATSPDAPVIELTATGTNAQRTATVANAMAKALADYGTTRKADTHVGLEVLAGAVTPAKPTSPKPPMELAVGAAGGLLIGGLAVLAGVGRPGAKREEEEEPAPKAEETAPARYEAEVDEPSDQPAAIERYTGVAHAEQAPKAIASYRATATPAYLDAEEAPDDGDEPVRATIPVRIVGRAQVAGTEDDA
jgi:capsular polysaccharide biosynthesis protein